VTVLEAAGRLGGRAATELRDGFALNLGPHALYLGGAGIRVLRGLGVDPPGGSPDLSRAAMLFQGALHPGLFTARGLATSRLLGLGERAAVAAFLARLPRARLDGLGAVTEAAWLDGCRLPGRARLVAETLVRVAAYSDAPGLLAADAAAGQVARSLRGVRYVHGGWATIVDALRRRAVEAGARIRTGVRVDAVGSDGGRPVVALAGGGELPGDAGVVVAAGGPRVLARLTGGAPRHTVAARMAVLDVALRRWPSSAPGYVFGLDTPIYLSNHSASARLGPGAVVHVAAYLGPGADADRGQLERVLDLAAPGWRDDLVRARFLPDLTVVSAVPLAAEGGLAGRPDAEVAGLPGVAAAGDWVGPEGLLADASLVSAQRAAAALLRPAPRRAGAAR
jgi:phytoene dehydrogenase-like protein